MNKPRRPRRSYGVAGPRTKRRCRRSCRRKSTAPWGARTRSSPKFLPIFSTQVEATSTAHGSRWCQQFFQRDRHRPRTRSWLSGRILKAFLPESVFFPTPSCIIQPNHVYFPARSKPGRTQKYALGARSPSELTGFLNHHYALAAYSTKRRAESILASQRVCQISNGDHRATTVVERKCEPLACPWRTLERHLASGRISVQSDVLFTTLSLT